MRKMNKFMVAALALGLMVTSPMTTMTTHAMGFNWDAPEHEDVGTEDCWGSGSSSDSSSSSSSDSGSSSGSSYEAPSYSYDNGGSSDNNSYSDNSGSYDNSSSSDNGGSSVAAPAKNPNDITVSAAGSQKFRIVMNFNHTYYEVFHCGLSKATFAVADAKGNPVYFKSIAVEQGEDNLWYVNLTFRDDEDTTGYTVGVTKGDATYLSTELGVSGIKINGNVVLSTVAEK